MTHVFRIEDSNPYAKSIVAFLKTLDFVQEEKVEKAVKFPSMTEKQVINRVDLANKQIKQGKTISQDQLYKESQNW